MGWLFAFPIALDSDDALNFAHGVTRFSVLEFSPHFPGYPAFIWLARLINLLVDDPARAVQWAKPARHQLAGATGGTVGGQAVASPCPAHPHLAAGAGPPAHPDARPLR
ncbi:hypothetical protein ASJ31_02640, partial [Aeromonas salmonicida subsp. salmonicida]